MSWLRDSIRAFWQQGDRLLLTLCLLASGYGMVLIFSATRYLETNRNMIVQGLGILLGVAVYIIMSSVDIELLTEKSWKWLILFNVVINALVRTPLGVEVTIPAQRITEAVAALCIEANTHLPADVEAALQAARASEPWPLAQTTLGLLCDNLTAAGEAGLPICQDTGMACVFVELGTDVHIEGDFEAAIHDNFFVTGIHLISIG